MAVHEQHHRLLLPQYATNATLPYPNDWCHWSRKQRRAVHDRELHAAKEAAEKHMSRKRSSQLKFAFLEAICKRDVTAATQLLQEAPMLLERRTPAPWRATALCFACTTKGSDIVALLLERGADVLQGDAVGATPLILAAAHGATEVIALLLSSKQGGNAGRQYLLNQCTNGGETAVMAAAKAGHTDTLKSLLAAGAVSNSTTHAGMTALMLACKYDRVECAKVLLQEAQAKADGYDRQGRNALMHAAGGGALQTVKMLLALQPQPDVTRPDMEGLTAIHHACIKGSAPCAEALMAAGASLAPAHTPPDLLVTAAKGGQGDMVAWLLSKGVGKDSLMDPGPGNPMFAAVRGGSIAAVDALLVAGARLQVRDQKGRTPLAVAALLGKHSMMQLLVARGASMLDMDQQGQVPRQLAQRYNQRETAQRLSELAKASLIVPENRLEAEAARIAAL